MFVYVCVGERGKERERERERFMGEIKFVKMIFCIFFLSRKDRELTCDNKYIWNGYVMYNLASYLAYFQNLGKRKVLINWFEIKFRIQEIKNNSLGTFHFFITKSFLPINFADRSYLSNLPFPTYLAVMAV